MSNERRKYQLVQKFTMDPEVMDALPGLAEEIKAAVSMTMNGLNAKIEDLLRVNSRLLGVKQGHTDRKAISVGIAKIEPVPSKEQVESSQQQLQRTAEELSKP